MGEKLTDVEQRVAREVARGRTNHEVADALHLSEKTVEWNLTKVYRKLGVRSRTELALNVHRFSLDRSARVDDGSSRSGEEACRGSRHERPR